MITGAEDSCKYSLVSRTLYIFWRLIQAGCSDACMNKQLKLTKI